MDIRYTIKLSRRRKKTICLQVTSPTEVTVCAPIRTSEADIRGFIDEKQNWIAKAVRLESEKTQRRRQPRYASGETLYYLGNPHLLEVAFDPLAHLGLRFDGTRFFLNCPDEIDRKRSCAVAWYTKRAAAHLSGRVAHFSRIMGLEAQGVKITQARSRWGSCSEKNRLSFSFRLMMAPPEVIDYIVVHELAHIAQKNHSSKFWSKVLETVKDYKSHRRWLRDHQHLFEI